jgi:hypothetical protein
MAWCTQQPDARQDKHCSKYYIRHGLFTCFAHAR